MTTPRALARTAGVLYLLLAGAAFNERYVLPRIVKSGDAAATHSPALTTRNAPDGG